MKASKSLLIGDLSFKYTSRSRPALGLIVAKYYGNSVARNLFKRRCRVLFKSVFINRGALVSLIVRPNKKDISFIDMSATWCSPCYSAINAIDELEEYWNQRNSNIKFVNLDINK